MNSSDLHDPEHGRAAIPTVFAEPVEHEEPRERIDLRALLSFVPRRLRLIVLVFGVVLGVSYLAVSRQPRIYTAAADVVMQTAGARSTSAAIEGGDGGASAVADLDTEITVLYSREIARKVAERLNLASRSGFAPDTPSTGRAEEGDRDAPAPTEAGGLEISSGSEPATPSQAVPDTEEVPSTQDLLFLDQVRSGLQVQRLGQAAALRIAYQHPDPAWAARLANAYAEVYVADQADVKRDVNQRASLFLSSRIDELREQAQADFRAVQQYRIENDLLSTRGSSLTEQVVSEVSQQLAAARAEVATAEANLAEARRQVESASLGDDLTGALSSSVVSSLRAQRARLATQLAELQGRYGPRHPDLRKVQRELAEVDQSISDEIGRILSNLEAQLSIARRREASLLQSLAQAKGDLEVSNQALVQLDDLERRAETSQALYETYLNSYKETIAREGLEESEARILSEARLPVVPTSPRTKLVLAFGALLGLGAGLGMAYFAELSFAGLTTARDVGSLLGVSFVGSIPDNRSLRPRGRSLVETLRLRKNFGLSEDVDRLLTSVAFFAGRPARVTFVTSALPSEGKSTTALALAIGQARRDHRVILIEADPYGEGVSSQLGVEARLGLREVLEGKVPLGDAVITHEETGIDVLPVVGRFEAESRLSRGGAFARLLDELREQYDAVLIDGAPILPVSETRELAALADVVILAVRWRKTSAAAVREALSQLPRRVRNLTAVCLTRVDRRLSAFYAMDSAAIRHGRYGLYRQHAPQLPHR